MEELLLDSLEITGTVFENSLNEFLILILRPVVTLFDIEILEVERAILKDNVLAVLWDESLSHLNDIVPLGIVQLVEC